MKKSIFILTILVTFVLILKNEVSATLNSFLDFDSFSGSVNISTDYDFVHNNTSACDTVNGITFNDVMSGAATPTGNQGFQTTFAQNGFVVSALAPDGSSPSGIPNFSGDDSMSLLIGAISVRPGDLLVSDRSLIALEPADLGLSPQFTFSFVDSTSTDPLTQTSFTAFGLFVDGGQPGTSTNITLTPVLSDGTLFSQSVTRTITDTSAVPDGFLGFMSDEPFYGVLFQSSGDQMTIVDGVDRVVFGDKSIGLNGTWTVKIKGKSYNYYTDQIDNITKTETITIESNANELTVTVTQNGGVDSDGPFTGFGGNNTFGATRSGSSWVDLIAGNVDSNNILSGGIIINDQYYGPSSGATSLKFSSDPSFGSEVKGDVNGDGKIGLEEAIHALQVVSGIATIPILDQINESGSVISKYAFSTDSERAQTFTVGISGQLAQVDVFVSRIWGISPGGNGDPNTIISIDFDLRPTDSSGIPLEHSATLSHVVVPNSEIPNYDDIDFVSINLKPFNIFVESGDILSIVLWGENNLEGTNKQGFLWGYYDNFYEGKDPYAGGSQFFSSTTTNEFDERPDRDGLFRTFVDSTP